MSKKYSGLLLVLFLIACGKSNNSISATTETTDKLSAFFQNTNEVLYRGLGLNHGCAIKLNYSEKLIHLSYLDKCGGAGKTEVYTCFVTDENFACDQINKPTQRIYFYGSSWNTFKFQYVEKNGNITDGQVFVKAQD